jgi:acylpyruvate hydrolase
MRFISFRSAAGDGLAIRETDGQYRGLTAVNPGFPGDLGCLLNAGPTALVHAAEALRRGETVDQQNIAFLPPLTNSGKIICIGLNYRDHSLESGFTPPDYPTVFVRFNSSLVAHKAPIVRPRLSVQLDYEGEMAAIIGTGGRHITKANALEHVAGYSLFNDASIRDYQFKSSQWTVGKNFDATGAFGSEFITADELPPGCTGVRFETRLNDLVVQRASTDDLIFDVATLVSLLSDAFTLSPGDIIVTGTPGGVGLARKPPLWMKSGDICEITSSHLGILSNPIVDEM